jgi:hypothetical protein
MSLRRRRANMDMKWASVRTIAGETEALGTAAFESGAAHRTGDGLGVALWLPPGVHVDDGPLEAVIAETIAVAKQADVSAMLERTEDCRPKEPHWYLSLIGVEVAHRSMGCGAALLHHGLRHYHREHLPLGARAGQPAMSVIGYLAPTVS